MKTKKSVKSLWQMVGNVSIWIYGFSFDARIVNLPHVQDQEIACSHSFFLVFYFVKQLLTNNISATMDQHMLSDTSAKKMMKKHQPSLTRANNRAM